MKEKIQKLLDEIYLELNKRNPDYTKVSKMALEARILGQEIGLNVPPTPG